MHSISEEAAAEIETLSADNLRLRAELHEIRDTAWTVVAVIEAAREAAYCLDWENYASDKERVTATAILAEALETFDSLNTPYDSQKE